MISNIPEVTIDQVLQLLPKLLKVKRAILIHGPVGIGKTDCIAEWAYHNDYDVYGMILAQVESVDVRGCIQVQKLTVGLNKGTYVTTWAAPISIPLVVDKPTLFVMDEFYAAQPEVLVCAAQILTEHRVGENKLDEKVRVICLTNDEVDGSYTASEDNKSINTKVTHFRAKADAHSWLKWAEKSGVHPTVLAWIRAQPEYIYDYKAMADDHLVYACPRTLVKLSDAVYEIENGDGKEGFKEYANKAWIAGIIGSAASSLFLSILNQVLNMRPLEDFINAYRFDPDSVKALSPTNLQMTYALAYSLIRVAKKPEEMEIAIGIMLQVCTSNSGLNSREIFAMFMEMVADTVFKDEALASYIPQTKVCEDAVELGLMSANWAETPN